jgi:excisionase family DNA binding protein
LELILDSLMAAEAELAEVIQASNRAWTLAELAKLLHCSRTTLYDMVERGRIPHLRVGSMLRFDPVATAQWLRERTIG